MNRKMLNHLLCLTETCLERYWQLDYAFVMEHCAEDVVWVGSLQQQFFQGYEAVEADFARSVKELKPCHLLHQEFMVVQNQGNCCTIVGRYLTTTDKNVDFFLQVQQRCTFVWEVRESQPKIIHMHVSNPMGELKVSENELFVNEIGKMAKEYFMHHIQQVTNTKKVVLEDINGVTRFLSESDVIYAEADNKHTLIHTVQETFCAKSSITQFDERTGPDFVSIHRSFVVNMNFVSKIKRYFLILTDGSEIPIPAKKYNAIRQILIKPHMES